MYSNIECMGKITIKIDDDLEKDLRVQIAQNRGKKGDLTKAIEDGLRLWLKEENKNVLEIRMGARN